MTLIRITDGGECVILGHHIQTGGGGPEHEFMMCGFQSLKPNIFFIIFLHVNNINKATRQQGNQPTRNTHLFLNLLLLLEGVLQLGLKVTDLSQVLGRLETLNGHMGKISQAAFPYLT